MGPTSRGSSGSPPPTSAPLPTPHPHPRPQLSARAQPSKLPNGSPAQQPPGTRHPPARPALPLGLLPFPPPPSAAAKATPRAAARVACRKSGRGQQSKNRYRYITSSELLRTFLPPAGDQGSAGPWSTPGGRVPGTALDQQATPSAPTAGGAGRWRAGGRGERPGEHLQSRGSIHLFSTRPLLFSVSFLHTPLFIFSAETGELWNPRRENSACSWPRVRAVAFPSPPPSLHTYCAPWGAPRWTPRVRIPRRRGRRGACGPLAGATRVPRGARTHGRPPAHSPGLRAPRRRRLSSGRARPRGRGRSRGAGRKGAAPGQPARLCPPRVEVACPRAAPLPRGPEASRGDRARSVGWPGRAGAKVRAPRHPNSVSPERVAGLRPRGVSPVVFV